MATAMPSVQQIVQKWQQNTSGATSAYTAGVQRVQSAPGQAAAAKKQKWLQAVISSQDKWANNVAAVSLQAWQQQCVSKGAANLATGVNAATPKATAFWQKFLPVLQQARDQVAQMASDTFEQRKQKATAMMDLLHQFSNKM